MKAIILAAWEWSRLRPLTNTIPKPLIEICWKSIIEYNLEDIYKKVSEIIIVVKYKKELFFEKFWDNYKWTQITYITQWEEKWTAAALFWIESKMDILVLNWDSIYNKKNIKNIIDLKWYWVLTKEVENPEKYWIFKIDVDWNIISVTEKPKEFIWNLASFWAYKFNSKILEYVNQIQLSSRNEYELTDAINLFVKAIPLKALKATEEVIDITYPWDILSANNYYLEKLKKSKIKWTIEEWVTIKWNIILEEWSILKSWTYIEWNVYIWKNTSIWPNTYLRNWTTIWHVCKIWNAVEVKNTSIWDNTNIAHLSYIWDSIIWNNVNIGWGFITANLRHDKTNIKVPIKWILTNTWLHKLWMIMWDNCKIWINSSSMPWRVIENNMLINPGIEIK